jgi:hypothetical protein
MVVVAPPAAMIAAGACPRGSFDSPHAAARAVRGTMMASRLPAGEVRQGVRIIDLVVKGS